MIRRQTLFAAGTLCDGSCEVKAGTMTQVLKICAAMAILCGGLGSWAHAAESLRAWTSKDSVAVRYVTLDQENSSSWIPYRSEPIVFSPDGRHLFFLTHWGDISSDSNVYELQVFDCNIIRERLDHSRTGTGEVLSPIRVVRRKTFSSSDPGIINATWSSDSRYVLFLGTPDDTPSDHEGPLQLYRFEVNSGETVKLTHHQFKLEDFHERNGGLVFTDTELEPLSNRRPTYPDEPIQRDEKAGGSVVAWRYPSDLYDAHTFVSFGGSSPQPIAGYVSGAGISPDGRLAFVRHVPRKGVITPIPESARVVLVDLQTGKFIDEVTAEIPRPFVRSPPFHVLWSKDGRHAVLVNVALKGDGRPDGARSDATTAVVADYDVVRKRWQVLEPLSTPSTGQRYSVVDTVGWLGSSESLLITHQVDGRNIGGTMYKLHGDQWVGQSVGEKVRLPLPRTDFAVDLRQSSNEPSLVVASRHGREIALQPSDPALRGVWRAPMEPFEFEDSKHNQIIAGLSLPRGIAANSRIPIVIQTTDYRPELFLPDGPSSTAFAAQPLLARGIGVIQLATNTIVNNRKSGLQELDTFQDWIQSAIEALVQANIADPNRIGIIGFSHSGFDIYYAITHPGHWKLKAAVCGDFYTGSYGAYSVTAATIRPGTTEEDSDYGGSFWNNKSEWLERETSFNVDKVQTAALFTLNGSRENADAPGYTRNALSLVGPFLINRKPLEYLFFPDGAHSLQRPRERIAMLEATADWMSFWLQGYEDSDPEKAVQYARWRPMRGLLGTAQP
jgi:dipeptidyl aminopeptidase/acylaminoacyl peptidase